MVTWCAEPPGSHSHRADLWVIPRQRRDSGECLVKDASATLLRLSKRFKSLQQVLGHTKAAEVNRSFVQPKEFRRQGDGILALLSGDVNCRHTPSVDPATVTRSRLLACSSLYVLSGLPQCAAAFGLRRCFSHLARRDHCVGHSVDLHHTELWVLPVVVRALHTDVLRCHVRR